MHTAAGVQMTCSYLFKGYCDQLWALSVEPTLIKIKGGVFPLSIVRVLLGFCPNLVANTIRTTACKSPQVSTTDMKLEANIQSHMNTLRFCPPCSQMPAEW